jgi:hypothetical protein
MEKITNSSDLEKVIFDLGLQKEEEWVLVKEQFHNSMDRLNPFSIMKNEFKEFVSSPTLKHDLINAGIGVATGFIAKKVLIGQTNNPFSKVFGFITEFVVANQVGKNADGIQGFGKKIFSSLFANNKNNPENDLT